MRSHLISISIGAIISFFIALISYRYFERQGQSDYLKSESRFFESIEILQNRIDDLKMTNRAIRQPTSPIALVAIDDASLEEIGRWPWSRAVLADLTNEVLSNGAATITYDLVMPEPERENPLADLSLAKLVQEHSDRFILGTAASSTSPIQAHPYQDICTAEAFLFLGGDKIVSLNPTFVVDDQTETFDDYKWSELFQRIFTTLSEETERQFLQDLSKNSTTELSLYQKNSLRSKKGSQIYSYCLKWLEIDDPFLQPLMQPQMLPLYQSMAEAAESSAKIKKDFQLPELVARLKKMKPHPIPQYLGWYANTSPIQEASKYTASFINRMDSDGIIRRYPLFQRIGAKVGSSYIPSLALQTYLIAKKYRAEVGLIENTWSNEKQLNLFKIFNEQSDSKPVVTLPIDSFAQLRLNYYGPQNSFYYVSAKELLTKKQQQIEVQIRQGQHLQTLQVNKKFFFSGRSVFLGATALGTHDLRNTPVQNAMPGPEIHLTALANLFEQNFILDIKNAILVMPLTTLAFGLVFTLIWTWGSALISLVTFVVLFVSLVLFDYFVFTHLGYLLTNWSIFVVFISTFAAISLFKYFTEERNKSKVRKAFAKYVSPAVVEEILKNEKNLELGGSKRNLTVVFSDLRGFTTFSEKLDPKRLSDFLNMYLTRMTEEIYKTQGTVDKFIGDAIMAFFGAPVPYADHAQQACRCALSSIHKLAILNEELKDRNFPHLEMGLGINSGEVSVGNMGSATIQNYTVMGDAVNLASRLEGLTRIYGNFIILGPLTYEAAKDNFVCRELDQVVVKGKTEAIRIYDLLYEGKTLANDEAWLNLYKTARNYYCAGDFQKAKETFVQCTDLRPSDNVSHYFIKKCTDLIANPPKEAWTGINHLREK